MLLFLIELGLMKYIIMAISIHPIMIIMKLSGLAAVIQILFTTFG